MLKLGKFIEDFGELGKNQVSVIRPPEPVLPPSHLGVAGLLDGQVSRRQVTGDGDAEVLG